MRLKVLAKNSPEALAFSYEFKKLAKELGFEIVESHQDYTIVIGGDGTLLKAIKEKKPVIGIKFGRRSALLDVEPTHAKEMLLRLKNGDYKIEDYMLLEAESKYINAIAFNEIAVLFDNPETVYGSVNVSNKKITFEGDGVLISTPQGSWAWSYSATRTLIHRRLNAIEITFMNCIIPDIKTLIIPSEEQIKVKLEDKGRIQNVKIIVDGEVIGYLRSNEDEVLKVKTHNEKAKILRFYSQLEIGGTNRI